MNKGKTHIDYINSYKAPGITLFSATNLAIKQVEIEIKAFPNNPHLPEILIYLEKVKLSNEYNAMQKYEGLIERISRLELPDKVRINEAEVVIDVKHYINTLKSKLEYQSILSNTWKSNYMKLYNLIKTIESSNDN